MRKGLLIALLVWLVGSAADVGAQTFVQLQYDDTNPFTVDGIADITISPTAGNTVCVGFGVPTTSRTVTSVVDSVGSTVYTLTATAEIAGSREGWSYCGIVVGSPTSISITLSSPVAAGGFAGAAEFSGAHASDSVGNVVQYNDTTGTTHNSGSLTITGSSATVFAFVFGSNGVYTPDDYTSRYNATLSSDQAVTADKAITANDEMNLTTAGNEGVMILLTELLPPAAAGGGGCNTGGLLLLGAGKC